jgi:hypothetical protein
LIQSAVIALAGSNLIGMSRCTSLSPRRPRVAPEPKLRACRAPSRCRLAHRTRLGCAHATDYGHVGAAGQNLAYSVRVRSALRNRSARSRIVEGPVALRPNGRRPGGYLIRHARFHSVKAKPRERIPKLTSERVVCVDRGRILTGTGPAARIILLRRVCGGLSEPDLRQGLEQRSLCRRRRSRP